MDAGSVGEGFGKRGQNGLEVSVGGYVDLARGGLGALRLGAERHEEQADYG
jgi:hypothetical protein